MGSKKKVVHTAGEFQLEVPEDTPLALRMLAGGLIKAANDYDNLGIDPETGEVKFGVSDGKSDVAQIAPKVQAAIPFILAIAPHIDLEKFAAWAIDTFSKNKKETRFQLNNILRIANNEEPLEEHPDETAARIAANTPADEFAQYRSKEELKAEAAAIHAAELEKQGGARIS